MTITPKGDLQQGVDFWTTAKGENVTLKIKLLYAHFNDNVKCRQIEVDGQLIDFSAHVHLTYKLLTMEGDEIVKNDGGGIFGNWCHRTGCPSGRCPPGF